MGFMCSVGELQAQLAAAQRDALECRDTAGDATRVARDSQAQVRQLLLLLLLLRTGAAAGLWKSVVNLQRGWARLRPNVGLP